jgi:hypothetical protein
VRVGLREQDLGVERVAPFDDRSVKVRVARRHRLQPAEVFDKLDGPIVKESRRVP